VSLIRAFLAIARFSLWFQLSTQDVLNTFSLVELLILPLSEHLGFVMRVNQAAPWIRSVRELPKAYERLIAGYRDARTVKSLRSKGAHIELSQ
jgi:hypothetical protein